MALKIFKRFDPRLSIELRKQRKTIVKGLLCAFASAMLTVATIPVLRDSLQAIQDAGRLGQQSVLSGPEVDQLSHRIDRAPFKVVQALSGIEAAREDRNVLLQSEEVLVAQRLGVTPDVLSQQLSAVYQARTGRPLPTGPDALKHLALLCGLIVALFVLKYWFTRGVTYFMSRAANRLAADLRMRMFEKLQRLPISYFNSKRSGAIQSVLTSDVSVFQTAVTIIRDSLEGPVKMVAAFGAIIYLQWQLGLVALAVLPVMLFIIQRNSKRMRVAQKKVQEDLADVAAMTNEALQGTRIVRAFSAEQSVAGTYRGLVDESFNSQMRAVGWIAALRPMVELIGAIGLAVVLLLCGWLAYSSTLQVADIAAIVYALDIINQGFRNLASVNNTYTQVQVAATRIYGEILDVPEEHIDARGTLTLADPKGSIEFKSVWFTYPDGTEALRNVSFALKPGESLALVGPSGAGKSTIADLMLRFYDPDRGQIMFDGTDIRELEIGWLRSQIGVVPQQTFLFAGTIADNIRMGRPSASESEVVEAAKAAHADEFVSEMPLQYETLVNERGVRLSGGQMQRVAIARALIRRPTVLLLDEATSALDAHSERKVQAALDGIMEDRTTLCIAHRLTTAARADRIVVLRRGEVVEQGSHAELLAKSGAYAGMVAAFGSAGLDGVLS